ncbi:SslE/AcfD family lipoprotein zinc metalloprotease [Parendozoicomonas haliclonae]|uniref:Chitinase A n=1 Tax=Parendozoicomonas haliclonae TaxID=1960125 RepID=A0A1X7AGM5_9GAMM|nr:SslE/AcfD family lipoprotein zinc metalloprotease [Parendozoicomonas haliclonae]SMA39456.1 Chitinase A precursor [Parendozoicomonas haliclonae]
MFKKSLLSLCVATLLSGCFDGGGGSSHAPVTPEPPPTVPDNHAPTIAPISTQSLKADSTLSIQVKASDADGDDIHYDIINRPLWAVIDGNGFITLSPSTKHVGNHTVTIRASDDSLSSTSSFDVTVTPIGMTPVDPDTANHAPVIDKVDAQTINAGSSLIIQIKATDSNGDKLAYSLIDGPGWASIDESGKLALSPTTEDMSTDAYELTVKVSDGSLSSSMKVSVTVNPLATDLEPPTTATYKGKLSFNNKTLMGDISCEGSPLSDAGEFPFTVTNGEKSISCSFGEVSDLVTVDFSFSDLLGKAGDPSPEYIRNFDLKADGDLGIDADDAYKLLNNISTCSTESDKICLDELDSYDIQNLYRSGDKEAIEAFLNPVVAEEGEQPSAHVDPEQAPAVTEGTSNNLNSSFVSANAESAYQYVPARESKPLTKSKLTMPDGTTPLIGVQYFSQSANGVTDENGEFDYLWGENLVFGIDTFTLGEVKGNKVNYTLNDLSSNEQVQLNLQTLVDRYDIGTSQASSEKVREVFAQYPNVINELINLTLPNGAVNEECLEAKLPPEICTTPKEFDNQFTQGLTQQIDLALKTTRTRYASSPRSLLRAGSGNYVTESLTDIFAGVDQFHIFHDNFSWYAAGFPRAMRNFNLTNEAFPVLMPRNDNNHWQKYGEEAAWSRGSGKDKKAYIVDATTINADSDVIMHRPPEISKETATYNLPTIAAGLIGTKGKVVFLGNAMYTSVLSCPDNYWASGDLHINAEIQECYYQAKHNPEAQASDLRNDQGSMKTFFSNLLTWLAPEYNNGEKSLKIVTNIEKGHAFRFDGSNDQGLIYDFFINKSFNQLEVERMERSGFVGITPENAPVLLLQSFEIKIQNKDEDYDTRAVVSDISQPKLTEDDVTALIEYVNAGGNIIFFDALKEQNPAPIARLADAAGLSIGGANQAILSQTRCGNSIWCWTDTPNLHAVDQYDIVVYERYADTSKIVINPNGTVEWPEDVDMPSLEIPTYEVLEEDGKTSVHSAFHVVTNEAEKFVKLEELKRFFPGVPLCRDEYQYEVNCIEVRKGHGIPVHSDRRRPEFTRYEMSQDVVGSMVKAANLGENINRLLAHEIYFRSGGKEGVRLSKAELTSTYDNLSVWLWNDTQYEYAIDSGAGDELGFKRAVEILNCYTNGLHGGGSACNNATQDLLTANGMLDANGELKPSYPLNWMEKPLTRIMLGRSFWDMDIRVDTSFYPGRPTGDGGSESITIHTQGQGVSYSSGNMQSTGLWAPQHQSVTVSGGVPATITIALVDDITGRSQHELALRRPSRVQKSWAYNGSSLTIDEIPYGGLIYIQPHEAHEDDLATFNFTKVLKASLWQNGEWGNPINEDVPLAEIDTGHFIYTTHVNNVANTDMPKFVADLNFFAEEASNFYGRDEKTTDGMHRRFTYEDLKGFRHRMVNDVQISIGAAHSGYPVMNTSFETDRTTVPTNPLDDWLIWHEVGHNLASTPFSFTGSTEVTNNILALYMQEQREGDKGYMERIEGTLRKVEPWLNRHNGHGWSEGDSAMRLAMFGQLKLWAEDHFKIEEHYPNADERPEVFGADQGWNMYKLAHRKAREGGLDNYCSASSTGLSQGDLMMTCLSWLSEYDLSDYFKTWNPSEAKADLPDGGADYSGGLTDKGFQAVTSMGFDKPAKSPRSYTSVR